MRLRWTTADAVLRALVLLWVLFPTPAPAQIFDGAPQHASDRLVVDSAQVRVDGQLLFHVRGIAAYPAERRAGEIAAKIKALAADETIAPDSLRMETGADGRKMFYLGETFQFGLFEADAEIEGVPLEVLAEVVKGRVKESIEAYRHDRSFGVVVRNTAYTVLLTLLLVAVLFGLQKLFHWFDRLAGDTLKKQIETLEEKSLKLVRAQRIWTVLRKSLVALRYILIALIAYLYLNTVLSLFPLTREVGNLLLTLVVEPLMRVMQAILAYIPSLIFLVIVVLLARYLLGSIRTLFGAIHRGSVHFENFDPEWAWPTYRLVRVAVIVFALVIAYPYIPGSDSGAFKGISLFLGVLFSIGSTSVIANFVAGYTMTYRRAFRVGDRVRIGDTVGQVAESRLLVTHLRTIKNEEVIVPNSLILNSNVINYSSLAAKDGLILHTSLGIGYEVPWRQVEAMLLMAAQRTAGLLAEPKPFVLQTGLGDFAVNYELNAYCGNAEDIPGRYSELHRNILDVFNEFGVQIMTPNYETDPVQPKLVTKDHWYDAPAIASPSERD